MTFKPYEPLVLREDDVKYVQALRAIQRGEATKEQQIMFVEWMVQEPCMTHQPVYFDNERDSSFASGRRWVGLTLIKLIKVPMRQLFPHLEGSTHVDRPRRNEEFTEVP